MSSPRIIFDGEIYQGQGAISDGSMGVRKRGSTTITAGNLYVDVTHGLGVTCAYAFAMATSDLAGRSIKISNKGATTFRINISSADLQNHTFDWEASA